jgi:hypothetical protein
MKMKKRDWQNLEKELFIILITKYRNNQKKIRRKLRDKQRVK